MTDLKTITEQLSSLKSKFEILDVIDCNSYSLQSIDFYNRIKKNHRDVFENHQRLVFIIDQDYYNNDIAFGLRMHSIQIIVNTVDISNAFVIVLTTNKNHHNEYKQILNTYSTVDKVPIEFYLCEGEYKIHQTDESLLTKFKLLTVERSTFDDLSINQKYLLYESENFCIAPWVHLMIKSNRDILPCCRSSNVLGKSDKTDLRTAWNQDNVKKMRVDLINNKPTAGCERCYNDERYGRESSRKVFNQKFAKHIKKIDLTDTDGHLHDFSLNYWDSRFDNLCNLSCRSCDPVNSSSWYKPAIAFGLIEKEDSQKARNRIEIKNNEIYNQLLEHIDYVEEIYFAGGEPLIMEKHYVILNELIKRNRRDVKISYSTNFTKTSFRGQSVFDLWNEFDSVTVGASLDAEGARAEYLRSGTVWNDIVENRLQMKEKSPNVDFWVTCTVGIINALHVPDFHRSWIDQGLINPQDFNLEHIYKPHYMRVDTATLELKEQIIKKYLEFIKWLEPNDPIGRATLAYRGIIRYLDNLRPFDKVDFWNNVNQLDRYYKTDLLDVFPELNILPK